MVCKPADAAACSSSVMSDKNKISDASIPNFSAISWYVAASLFPPVLVSK
jgi:hypothetical protein